MSNYARHLANRAIMLGFVTFILSFLWVVSAVYGGIFLTSRNPASGDTVLGVMVACFFLGIAVVMIGSVCSEAVESWNNYKKERRYD